MKCELNKAASGLRRERLNRPGFTLIELMIVIFILAVLVAIVVSVSGYVTRNANEKETAATQALLINAIQAWRDKNTDKTTNNGYPANPSVTPPVPSLINQLTVVNTNPPIITEAMTKAATEILLKLPKEAWPTPNSEVLDAWGRPMQYLSAGGLGGTPVIISRGPDGTLGNDDDIRSDESQ